jgi:hypothetical protein
MRRRNSRVTKKAIGKIKTFFGARKGFDLLT